MSLNASSRSLSTTLTHCDAGSVSVSTSIRYLAVTISHLSELFALVQTLRRSALDNITPNAQMSSLLSTRRPCACSTTFTRPYLQSRPLASSSDYIVGCRGSDSPLSPNSPFNTFSKPKSNTFTTPSLYTTFTFTIFKSLYIINHSLTHLLAHLQSAEPCLGSSNSMPPTYRSSTQCSAQIAFPDVQLTSISSAIVYPSIIYMTNAVTNDTLCLLEDILSSYIFSIFLYFILSITITSLSYRARRSTSPETTLSVPLQLLLHTTSHLTPFTLLPYHHHLQLLLFFTTLYYFSYIITS